MNMSLYNIMSAELLERIRAGWKDTENVLKENRRMIAELSQNVRGLDKTKSASVRVQIKEGKKRLAEMTKHHREEKKELNELVRRHTTERRMIKRMLKSVSTTKTRKRCPNAGGLPSPLRPPCPREGGVVGEP